MASESSFIEQLARLSNSGEPFVAVTLARATGSTPQDAGSKMLVTSQGLEFGTVGGGKVEAKAIGVAKEMLVSGASVQLVDWNLKRDVGMTCGGSVSLLFETYNVGVWRIVIFGAGHVANALTTVLKTLRCNVLIIDPRPEWLAKIPQCNHIRCKYSEFPADQIDEIENGTFVLCMTMGHTTDLPILTALLKSGKNLPYLGVIGSRAKRAVLAKELAVAQIAKEKIESIVCPIGLPIGCNHPGEIAISIVSQLIQVRDKIVSASDTKSEICSRIDSLNQ